MNIQDKRGVKLKDGSILQSLYETVTILYGKTVPSLPPSGIFIYLCVNIWSKKLYITVILAYFIGIYNVK